MSRLQICALRNSECMVCLEQYGTARDGIQNHPVILTCGHDLCERCGREIRGSCPMCRRESHEPRKPFVECHEIVVAEETSRKSLNSTRHTRQMAELSKLLGHIDSICSNLREGEDEDKILILQSLARATITAREKLADSSGIMYKKSVSSLCSMVETLYMALDDEIKLVTFATNEIHDISDILIELELENENLKTLVDELTRENDTLKTRNRPKIEIHIGSK